MIARVWKGTARDADAYLRHLDGNVLPQLKTMAGFRDIRVLRHDKDIVVMTFWDSMDAVRAFAGHDCDKAVVEPEARAVLADFDDFVTHYEVAR
jgi:heme-degrading monooxygenase HmoA